MIFLLMWRENILFDNLKLFVKLNDLEKSGIEFYETKRENDFLTKLIKTKWRKENTDINLVSLQMSCESSKVA